MSEQTTQDPSVVVGTSGPLDSVGAQSDASSAPVAAGGASSAEPIIAISAKVEPGELAALADAVEANQGGVDQFPIDAEEILYALDSPDVEDIDKGPHDVRIRLRAHRFVHGATVREAGAALVRQGMGG